MFLFKWIPGSSSSRPARLRGALFVVELGSVRRGSRRPVHSPWRPRLMPRRRSSLGRAVNVNGRRSPSNFASSRKFSVRITSDGDVCTQARGAGPSSWRGHQPQAENAERNNKLRFDLANCHPYLRGGRLWRKSRISHCGGLSVNPGSRSRFGPPQLNLAELKLLTDDQLMVQLQEGVNDALAVLFERYHRLVFSIALKIEMCIRDSSCSCRNRLSRIRRQSNRRPCLGRRYTLH